jgi:hypothetical protein
MKKIVKNLFGIIFTFLIITIFILNIFISDKEVSLIEKRKLHSFPLLTIHSLLSGDFSEDFNIYVKDQQIFKKELNSIASFIDYKLFLKNEVKNIVLDNESLYELLSFNETNVRSYTNQLLKIQDIYKNNKQYTVIVPDKSFYLDKHYPNINNDELDQIKIDYVDLFNLLSESDFYKSDLHLTNQGSYKIYQYLADILDYKIVPVEFVKAKSGFIGYYAVKASYLITEEINKPLSAIMDELIVSSMNSEGDFETHKGCYYDDVDSNDLYSYMLDGNKAVTIITNRNSDNNKELVIFKDSYALSIAPYLAQNYSKVTLIDLRLIPATLADKYISENAEILYYYGFKSFNSNINLK